MASEPTSRRPLVLAALLSLVVTAALLLGMTEALPTQGLGTGFEHGPEDRIEPPCQPALPPPHPTVEAPPRSQMMTGPFQVPMVGEPGPHLEIEPDNVPPPMPRSQVPPELLRRMTEAARLGRAAQAGDAAAIEAVRVRKETEPDPRVRRALATGEETPLGEGRRHAVSLPAAAKAAESGTIDAYWLTPDRNGTYQSRISIDGDGRAQIETVVEGDPHGRWQVRYEAWAWRDAAGNLVVDSRGQQVDVIECPPGSWWSPDSMVIAPGGTVELIDDKFDPGQGTLGSRGPG